MEHSQVIPLDAVRTDGWFERIGEGIGSFQALCEIVGDRFVAFSLITGARITALSVDRRVLDNTIVDFTVGHVDSKQGEETQRLTLGDFRRRLIAALLTEEAHGPPPVRENDTEAIQFFIGVRSLLLAPLYGYSLQRLSFLADSTAKLELFHDGIEETFELPAFRTRLRTHVREELDRIASGSRGTIDLTRVAEAELAAQEGNHLRVRQLLGTWPAPLSIFLRTPDGQLLGSDARTLIAKGLGMLGTACESTGDLSQGEEIFRLGIQYAQDSAAAGDIFFRLGNALLNNERPGEAIAALRRALHWKAPGSLVWPLLARAFIQRQRYVAAVACLREAVAAGTPESELINEQRSVEEALGPALTSLRATLLSSPPVR